MKTSLSFLIALIITTSLAAQKGKEKSKKEVTKQEAKNKVLGKQKENTSKHDVAIWEGTKDGEGGGGPKPSKNQPAKVRDAFAKDYPKAANVNWSKYRGDWTATFKNGLTTSTAVYHANGERKDTRTVVQKTQVPAIVIDDILKKRPGAILGDIIKIEVPQSAKNIFRIKTVEANTPRFNFYDAEGKEISYSY